MTLIYDTQSPAHITLSGSNGSGKSYLGVMIFFDNIIRRMGMRGFIVDPKWEYGEMGALSNKETPHNVWRTLGMNYIKYPVDIHPYTPFFCSEHPDKDNCYMLNTEEITIYDLMQLMNLSKGDNIDVGKMQDRIIEPVINYYQDMGDRRVKMDTLCPPYDVLMEQLKLTDKGTVVPRKLKVLYNEGILGDEYKRPDLFKLINSGETPCLQTSDDVTLRSRLAGLIQVEIGKIVHERRRAFRSGYDSILQDPIILFIDEYNIVANKKNFEFFQNIYDQMRAYGIGVIGLGPTLADFHRTVIKQSDYIIAAKIMPGSSEDKEIQKRLGGFENIELLYSLEDPGKTVHPQEFALINRDGDMTTFFPSISVSSFSNRKQRVPRIDTQITSIDASMTHKNLVKKRALERIKEMKEGSRLQQVYSTAVALHPEPLEREDIVDIGIDDCNTTIYTKQLIKLGYITEYTKPGSAKKYWKLN